MGVLSYPSLRSGNANSQITEITAQSAGQCDYGQNYVVKDLKLFLFSSHSMIYLTISYFGVHGWTSVYEKTFMYT